MNQDNMSAQHIAEHRAIMEALASANGVWLDPLVTGRSVLYVDLPTHFNIGDHLIMQGTERYLASRRIDVLGRRAIFQPLPDLPGHAVILCQGGGNFGDIYSAEQRFRESLVRRYPRHRIVMLPQTIHFRDRSRQAAAANVLRAHGDLHLAVRDATSKRTAEDMGLNVAVVPDMAHHLYPFGHRSQAGAGVLTHARRDGEKKAGAHSAAAFDWDDLTERHQLRNAIYKRWLKLSRHGFPWPSPDSAIAKWVSNSRALCDEAAAHYVCHERIVTDRLHGHILACLVDLPSAISDNSYGKVHAYARQWTSESPLVRFSETLDA